MQRKYCIKYGSTKATVFSATKLGNPPRAVVSCYLLLIWVAHVRRADILISGTKAGMSGISVKQPATPRTYILTIVDCQDLMWIPNWQCSTLWCFAGLFTRNNSIFKGHVIYPSDYVVIYSLLSYLFIRSLPHTVYIMYLTNTQEQILRIVTGHCLCNMLAIIIINQSNKLSLVKYYNYLPSTYPSKLGIFSQGLMYMKLGPLH